MSFRNVPILFRKCFVMYSSNGKRKGIHDAHVLVLLKANSAEAHSVWVEAKDAENRKKNLLDRLQDVDEILEFYVDTEKVHIDSSFKLDEAIWAVPEALDATEIAETIFKKKRFPARLLSKVRRKPK